MATPHPVTSSAGRPPAPLRPRLELSRCSETYSLRAGALGDAPVPPPLSLFTASHRSSHLARGLGSGRSQGASRQGPAGQSCVHRLRDGTVERRGGPGRGAAVRCLQPGRGPRARRSGPRGSPWTSRRDAGSSVGPRTGRGPGDIPGSLPGGRSCRSALSPAQPPRVTLGYQRQPRARGPHPRPDLGNFKSPLPSRFLLPHPHSSGISKVLF